MVRAALVAVILGLLAIAPVAQADWHLSKRKAHSFAQDAAITMYGAPHPLALCRPQGRFVPEPGHAYHRWICGWADTFGDEDGGSEVCGGSLLILGSRKSHSAYHYTVHSGRSCGRYSG